MLIGYPTAGRSSLGAKLSRREVLRLGAAGLAAAAMGGRAEASSPILAGAIRWDAWEAAGSTVIASVETTLGPQQYHDRAPFCATAPSPESIEFSRCDTQAAMDREIAYAAQASLAYWAYCWYGAADPMMNAWALHQSSAHKNRMNWCLILPFSRLSVAAAFAALTSTYVSYFRQANYQKVAGGRPLIYLFPDQPHYSTPDERNTWANVKIALSALQTACTEAGLARPYLVVMCGYPKSAHDIRMQIGGDAISNYMARVPPGKPASYKALSASVQAYWDEMAATGSPIVPICQTGWDTRPRKEHPPSWQHDQRQNIDMDTYVAAGTPAQIAEQIQAALAFVRKDTEVCAAQTVLIYSWDECDEGGSALVPTHAPAGANRAILDSIGALLRTS